ncbi:hypothetical protein IKF34_02335 [Candidatus Saccharibacteria bacterium]|nr:hypothetical protein [Candidatus Saccharibacteria bacterium]
MDSSNFQPVQPMSNFPTQGQAAQPVGVSQPQQYYTAEQVEKMMAPKKDVASLVKIIALIFTSLLSVTFIGLFIWKTTQYNEVKTDVDGQIAVAVAEAKDEQAQKLEAEFMEREKQPFRTFSGPADYGALTFDYPKTWSVYVAADAVNGGNFEAYFNPIQVDAVGRNSINALNLSIQDKSFDSVIDSYKRYVEGKEPTLTIESVTVNGAAANRYVGNIPGTDLNGIIVIFKIRDKTAVLQTDSMLFENDFNTLINTITFNA